MDFHQPKSKDFDFELRLVPVEELQKTMRESNSELKPANVFDDLKGEKQLEKPSSIENQTAQATSYLAVRTKECISDSVEMLSASLPKLTIDQPPDLAATILPAASNVSGNDLDILPSTVSSTVDAYKNGTVGTTTASPTNGDGELNASDAKARIKAALLNAERRRQQIGEWSLFVDCLCSVFTTNS